LRQTTTLSQYPSVGSRARQPNASEN